MVMHFCRNIFLAISQGSAVRQVSCRTAATAGVGFIGNLLLGRGGSLVGTRTCLVANLMLFDFSSVFRFVDPIAVTVKDLYVSAYLGRIHLYG